MCSLGVRDIWTVEGSQKVKDLTPQKFHVAIDGTWDEKARGKRAGFRVHETTAYVNLVAKLAQH